MIKTYHKEDTTYRADLSVCGLGAVLCLATKSTSELNIVPLKKEQLHLIAELFKEIDNCTSTSIE